MRMQIACRLQVDSIAHEGGDTRIETGVLSLFSACEIAHLALCEKEVSLIVGDQLLWAREMLLILTVGKSVQSPSQETQT